MILSKCNAAPNMMLHKLQPPMATRNISFHSTFWPGNFSTGNKAFLMPTVFSSFSSCKILCKIEVDTEKFKRRLIKKGFMPTPKIIHMLKKKEIQKLKRKANKNPEKEPPPRVKKVMEEEALFEKACHEYEVLMAELEDRSEDYSVGDGKFREEFYITSAGEEFSVSDGEFRDEEFCVSDGTVTEMNFSTGDGKFRAEKFCVGEGKSSGEDFPVSDGKFTAEETSVGDRKCTGEEISAIDGNFAVEEASVGGRKFRGDAFSFSSGKHKGGLSGSGRELTEGNSVSDRNLKEEMHIIDGDGYGYGAGNQFREMEKNCVSDHDDDDSGVGMEGTFRERAMEIEEKEGSNSSAGTVWSERYEKRRVSDATDKVGKMEERSLGRAMRFENSGLKYGVDNYRSEKNEIVRAAGCDERVELPVLSEEICDIDIDKDLDGNDDIQGVKMEGKSGSFWERAREIENNVSNLRVNTIRSERDGRMRAIHADEIMKVSVSHLKFTERVSVDGDGDTKGVKMKGRPWERAGKTEKYKGVNSGLSKCMSARDGRTRGHRSDADERVNEEYLEDFREMLGKRGKVELQDLHWLLDDELGDDELGAGNEKCSEQEVTERPRGPIDEEKQIQWLTERLHGVNVKMPTWQLSNLMHSARMKFTDGRLVKIVQVLGDLGNWKKAVEVVHWVHNRKRYQYCKGRYAYTTLLAVLGKARRPIEALNVFHAMREHISSYPDMPAYRCIATTLGQAGYLKELLNIIDCLRTGPAQLMKNVKFLHWDPRLEPDVVVYNAVLNACVPRKEWKGAFWVLQQMRQSGLRPSCVTYGLAIEVMVASGKYELVHMLVEKMGKAGLKPNALTYKAIVCTFRKEKKTDEALRAVEEMKCRGVVPTASVYYELASCFCSAGRWKDAMFQVENLCKCPPVKPLVVTFTGLIQCSAEAGHIHDCLSIFKYMQDICAPNIGIVNVMIKAYGENNMFQEAKALFEGIKKGRIGRQNLGSNASRLSPDIFTYNAMLEACAVAGEWGYLDNVYKQMILNGHSFDQNRHSWLIVAASRAGKSHLLDHAFDQLIEQGKIPHVSLYKEKICQSLQSEEYDNVINYINTMAKGSMELCETEWTELFKSAICITEDRLRHLSDKVNGYIAGDDLRSCIFSSLMKSLHHLCGLDTSLEPKKLINNLRMMKYDGQTHSYVNSMSLYSVGENEKVTIDIRNRYIMDNIGIQEHEQSSKLGMKNDILNTFVTEKNVDDLGDSKLPSSDEILMEWRQNAQGKSLVKC